MKDSQARAEVLVQAIPYIRHFSGKTIVVKYGGGAIKNQDLLETVMDDLVLLQLMGIRIVLVHGGGPFISRAMAARGQESVFVDGLRVTDQATIEVAQEVLAGGVNKRIVHALNLAGGRALGICGLDGHFLTARRHEHTPDLGFVGDIDEVHCGLLHDALERGYITVVASIAGGEDGAVYNINADHAAQAIASACGAFKLIVMTDVRGVLRDPDDPESLISVLRAEEIPALEAAGILSGGMIPKIKCCSEALARGVPAAHILDGTLPHALLLELLSDDGIGTMVLPEGSTYERQ